MRFQPNHFGGLFVLLVGLLPAIATAENAFEDPSTRLVVPFPWQNSGAEPRPQRHERR